jgi:hypothetical protein
MYIYVYVYTSICLYLHICIYIRVYIYIYISQESAPENWDFLNDEYILSHRDLDENIDTTSLNIDNSAQINPKPRMKVKGIYLL